MRMPMMDVWVVRMLVRQHFMAMPVRMWPDAAPVEVVGVLVVLIMTMRVRVFEGLVPVFVQVPLPHMQPDAKSHQRRAAQNDGAG